MYPSKEANEVVPLAYVGDGAIVEVVGIRGGYGFVRKLRDLGINEGSYLKVIKSIGPGPVIINLIDKISNPKVSSIGRRIALGYGIALKVMVRVVGYDP